MELRISKYFFGLLCLFAALNAGGDQVILHLKNGDRFTGTLLKGSGPELTLKTPYSAEIKIPTNDILRREVIAKSPPEVISQTSTNPASESAILQGPKEPAAPIKKAPVAFHADVQLGADVIFGARDQQVYTGRIKLSYAPSELRAFGTVPIGFMERFKTTLDLNGTYGETEGVLSANRAEAISKTDFDIGKKVYVYNLFNVGYDEIRRVDFRYEAGPGVGYHLVERTNWLMNVEFGMNYQGQTFVDGTERNRFYYRLAEDITWKISKRITFDEKIEFMPQADTLDQFRVRAEANLRYWFLENMSFNITLIDIYDTDPARTVSKNDLQIRSSIGMKF